MYTRLGNVVVFTNFSQYVMHPPFHPVRINIRPRIHSDMAHAAVLFTPFCRRAHSNSTAAK